MKQGAYADQHPPPLYPAPLRPPATSLLTVLAETPTITPKPTPFLELLLCAWHFVALCLCSDLAGGSRDTPFVQSRKQLRQAWETGPESAVRNEQSGTHRVWPQTAVSGTHIV